VHELSLCQAIADTIGERGGGRELVRVSVRIGHLRQVVPDSLQFSWQLLTEGSDLDGCRLEVEYVAAVVRCRACEAETTLDMPILACGSCGGVDVELRSGEEFLIASIDVSQQVT